MSAIVIQMYKLDCIVVSYGKCVGGLGLSADPELDREGVYKEESQNGDGMDAIYLYQPEHCDWKVVRITVGKCFCMLVVCTNKTLFFW